MAVRSDNPAIRFAVTTRSRLCSPALFPQMVRANADIKRQLSGSPGCVRFASVVAGPTEFWSISVWRTREAMLSFMRTGSHERFMWNISRWFSSFWLTRWSPSEEEYGTWDGLRLARPLAEDHAGLPPATRAGSVLSGVPDLLTAFGPDGAPTIERAPHVVRARRRVEGRIAILLRIPAPGTPDGATAWRDLRKLARALRSQPGVLRIAIGAAGPRELFGLLLLGDSEDWCAIRTGAAFAGVLERWGDLMWAMRWEADHEFGQWDGLRLRALRSPAVRGRPGRVR